MTDPSNVRRRVEEAGNLAEVLDASYEAFETMLTVIAGYQESGGPFYAGLVMAAAAAADGRDALLAAPSLPLPSWQDFHAAGLAGGAGSGRALARATDDPIGAAATVAALIASVASRLRRAAEKTGAAGDRAACLDAARYADEVLVLTRRNQR